MDNLLEKKIELLEKTVSYKRDPNLMLELFLLYDRANRFTDAYKGFEEIYKNYPLFAKGKLFRVLFLAKWGRKENLFELIEDYFFTKFFEEIPLSFIPTKDDIKKNLVFIREVIDNCSQAINFNKESLIDWIIKSLCYFYLEKEEFEEIFNFLFKNFVDNFKVIYIYSLLNIDRSDYSKAILYLKKLLELNPLFDDGFLLIGYCYLKQGIFNQALVNLRKAAELNNKKATSSLLLAKYLIFNERFDDAIDILYNRARVIEPNNPKVYYYLAQAYKGKNEYEKALKLYENLKIFNYQTIQIKKEMAEVYMALGYYNEAKKILEEIKEESILFDEEVFEKLIIINERMGNFNQALMLVKEALTFSNATNFYYLGAKIAFRLGNFDLAYEYYKKILETNPKDFESLYSLGIIELSKMRFGIAEKYFHEASLINPLKLDSYYFFALSYAFQDKIDKAIEVLLELREKIKDPLKYKIISFNIASAYSFLGDVEKTENFLYEAIADFAKSLKSISDQDMLFFSTLLFQTKVIINSSKTTKALEESQSQTIQAMIDAIQAKDQYTKDHTQRVAIVSNEIAKAMNLEEEILQVLLVGTLVHDIGKIGIPDSILNKPSKLTDEEFEIMKKHTTIGYEIVSKMKFPKLREIKFNDRFSNIGGVADCVRSHHEKWNGTGYPDGLKGEEIPLLARIIAVADVFDALISERQYKKGLPPFKCIEIIEQSKGTHFDPVIVDYFLKIVDDIIFILYAGKNRDYYDKSVEELLKMPKEDILRDIEGF